MLEKLDFQALVEATLTVRRVTRVMSMYQFVLGMGAGRLRRIFATESCALSDA